MTRSDLRHLTTAGLVLLTIVEGVAPAGSVGPGRGAGPAGEPQVGPTLQRAAVIDLPGPPGRRFDYLTIDYEDHYLFAAHQGPGLLYVVDLRTNAVVKMIPGVPGIEAVAYIPEGRKVYTSAIVGQLLPGRRHSARVQQRSTRLGVHGRRDLWI